MHRVIEQAAAYDRHRIRVIVTNKNKSLQSLIDVLLACYEVDAKRRFVWVCDLDTERRITDSLSGRGLLAFHHDHRNGERCAWLIGASKSQQPTIRFARSSGLGLERMRGLGLDSSVRVFVDLDYATDLVEAVIYPSMRGQDSGLIEYGTVDMRGMRFSHFFVDEG